MAQEGPVALKCIVVGDGYIGKTCMVLAYTSNEFREFHDATMFDNYNKAVEVDGRKVQLNIWDTAGQADYDRLRLLVYPNSNVVLACFSLADKGTLENIFDKWVPEIEQHCPGVPVILVGTKSDLKNDYNLPRGKMVTSSEAVTEQEKINRRSQVNCCAYLECSAKIEEGIQDVFSEAIRSALNPPAKKLKKKKTEKKSCVIL